MLSDTDYSLSPAQFQQLRSIITSRYGIKIPDSKRVFLASRVRSRLIDLGLNSFAEYLKYLAQEKSGQEFSRLEEKVTTNKTDFFREAQHFTFIEDCIEAMNSSKMLKCWSAGCSSGEEVYTLAMVLSELWEKGKVQDFSIFGTDISEKVLSKAKKGVYENEKLTVVPAAYKRKYLLKGKNAAAGYSKFQKKIRSKLTFAKLNLYGRNYGTFQQQKFDLIFCRNVLIYFDTPTQREIVRKLTNQLRAGGYLFIGHSESLLGMGLNLKQIKPAIYQKL